MPMPRLNFRLPTLICLLLAMVAGSTALQADRNPPKDVDDHYVSPAPKELPKPKKATSNVLVRADGLKDNKGQVCYALFNTSGDFLEVPFRRGVATISGKKSHVLFTNIPHGTYALAVFHDRNKNFKLDKNFVGVPSELYGFSQNARGTFGPPDWKDAKFTLTGELSEQSVTVK